MTKRLLLLLIAAAAPLAAERFLIRDATIVDGTGGAPYQGSLLVEGERIAAVGPQVAAPEGVPVIDARGKTLLPGLFDLHTHLAYAPVGGLTGDWPKNLKAYLYSGVTSVVDFGTHPATFEPMRRLLREGVIEGPRLTLAARISTPYGHGMEGGRGDFFTASAFTPAEGKAVVEQLLPSKPDVIKVFTDGWRYGAAPEMTSMPFETLEAIVASAHGAGLEVLTHTVTVERATEAARAGVDVIAHGVSDRGVDQELIRLMTENEVHYAPTLAVYQLKGRDILDPLLEATIDPAARARVKPPLTRPAKPQLLRDYDDPETPRARRWRNLIANNRVLHDAGVRFVVGTDAGVTNTWHGWATLRELQLLVHGGLSPLEALTAATGAAARALHLDGERGLLQAGKLADLVLVAGAPHEEIDQILAIERVWLGGREIDRPALARAIASPEPTPLPARRVPAKLDDFEGEGRTSAIGTDWVNATDEGLERAEMMFQRVARPDGDRALAVLARMSAEQDSWASVNLPLTPGAVEPADLSEYRGLRFEARGDGQYELAVWTSHVRDYRFFESTFEAGAEWRTVEIPFVELRRRGGEPANWTGRDALMLLFRIRRPAGEEAWLELDDLELYP